jgi:hypothetical protein
VIKRFTVICVLLILAFIACSDEDNGIGNVDGIFPAAINDLAVVDSNATSIMLTWTAPGDDSLIGNVSSYDIRLSSSPKVLIYYWNDAFSVPNIPRPDSVGTKETLWVDSLSFLVEHYFAIRSLDEEGNISYISNIAHGRPFGDSTVDFADDSLEAVIREHLGINPADTIRYSKTLELDTLNAKSRHISNLTGLHYAGNLTRLNLGNNSIDNINVLARLTSLDSLVLSYNQIANIDSLSNLTSLQYLHLDSNQIDSIDALSGLINLTHLYLDSNQIESIYPLVQNYGLDSGDYVWLRNNPLSDTLTDAYIDTLEARGVTVTR